MNERVEAILNFWFVKSTYKDYFKRSKNFDKKIRNRFKNDYDKATNNELENWQDDPKSCLALVILLDQFSRNLYRESPLAFKNDYKVRLIVNEAINKGDLVKLNLHEKFFLLLPLIHSENISDHIFAYKLYEIYLKNHPNYNGIKNSWNDHTEVIKKFHRYPHRNKILNRPSTSKEITFLKKFSKF